MQPIRGLWWNLQNFFDTDDDPISLDFEYTAANGWTPEVFNKKKNNLAKAINATHNGDGPDLLCVCEIEKDSLLEELIDAMGKSSALNVVKDPAGTRDYRGIDVTIAYNKNKLSIVSKQSHLVHLRYRTRDIYEVKFSVKETDEELVVIASHWPSRKQGKYSSEPLRSTVAENIAMIVESHIKFPADEYEELRKQNTAAALQKVQKRWNAKVLAVGDFNDEPFDRSVLDHLCASRDIERVAGDLNQIKKFKKETGEYLQSDIFLYNPMWKFLKEGSIGTYYMTSLPDGSANINPNQILDNLACTRGLLGGDGLKLDVDSIQMFTGNEVATSGKHPRPFDKKTGKGTSDHLPVEFLLK